MEVMSYTICSWIKGQTIDRITESISKVIHYELKVKKYIKIKGEDRLCRIKQLLQV